MPLINGGNQQWRVQAEVNGQPGIFILDTGANLTLITPQFAAKLGLGDAAPEVKPTGAHAKTPAAKMVRLGSLKLGDMNYVGFYAPVVNLDHINEAMQTEVAGILGNNLLNKTAYQIDWNRNTLLLMHTPRPERPPDALPITIREHRIFINAQINGQPAEFALDTGAYTSTLASAEVARLRIPANKQGKVMTPKIDISGSQMAVAQTQVQLDTFSAGPISIPNYTLLTWDHNVLGMNLLQPWILTVDPWQGWLSLKKAR